MLGYRLAKVQWLKQDKTFSPDQSKQVVQDKQVALFYVIHDPNSFHLVAQPFLRAMFYLNG